MPVLLVRITVPDRPGSLASVTGAIAATGADVVSIDVLGAEEGRAVDDVALRATGADARERIRLALEGLPGVAVESIRVARGLPGHRPDLDALTWVARDPGRALVTYADHLPLMLGADWAVLAEPGPGGTWTLIHRSPGAPAEPDLPLPATPVVAARAARDEGSPRTAALVGLAGGRWLFVAVRDEGPPFRRQELLHLQRVTDLFVLLAEPTQ
ncbi:MAG: ACT domain-containing protein [Actinomycetota bacterium]|nr:MAG: ACT domain-containing protein [Actinomycetota bacterium]